MVQDSKRNITFVLLGYLLILYVEFVKYDGKNKTSLIIPIKNIVEIKKSIGKV